MKRFFTFIVISTLLSSCAVHRELRGNITTYNANGSVLKSWKNVVIQSEVNYGDGTKDEKNVFKTFGVNFYDNTSGNFVVIGNSVPYIIEYKDNITQKNVTTNVEKDELKHLYYEYKEKISYYNKQMKIFAKNSEEYNKLKNEKEDLKNKKNEVHNTYYKKYKIYIE